MEETVYEVTAKQLRDEVIPKYIIQAKIASINEISEAVNRACFPEKTRRRMQRLLTSKRKFYIDIARDLEADDMISAEDL
jgi:hypothetical protein